MSDVLQGNAFECFVQKCNICAVWLLSWGSLTHSERKCYCHEGLAAAELGVVVLFLIAVPLWKALETHVWLPFAPRVLLHQRAVHSSCPSMNPAVIPTNPAYTLRLTNPLSHTWISIPLPSCFHCGNPPDLCLCVHLCVRVFGLCRELVRLPPPPSCLMPSAYLMLLANGSGLGGASGMEIF